MRKLDALVAEKVMDRKPVESHGQYFWDYVSHTEIPRYSTDIAAAWEVVAKFQENDAPLKNIALELLVTKLEGCHAKLIQWGTHGDGTYKLESLWEAEAESTPLAICLAALKACGVSEEEIKKAINKD